MPTRPSSFLSRAARPGVLVPLAAVALGAVVVVAQLPGTAPEASAASTAAASAAAAVKNLPADATADYQLGGAYAPASSVRVVVRDRTAARAKGKYNVCYVNAFQTQPGEKGLWPASVLLRDADGDLVTDPDWDDEVLLDTRTRAKRTAIMKVLSTWLTSCADKGFDAVEADNFDTFTRTSLLTKKGNVALAKAFVAKAHALGLAVAQKNAAEYTTVGAKTVGFDFAVAEECQVYLECASYTKAYGARVVEIEYTDNGGLKNWKKACTARGAKISVVYRDRDVVKKGRKGYVYKEC